MNHFIYYCYEVIRLTLPNIDLLFEMISVRIGKQKIKINEFAL